MRRIKAEIEKTGYSFLGGHSGTVFEERIFASLFESKPQAEEGLKSAQLRFEE